MESVAFDLASGNLVTVQNAVSRLESLCAHDQNRVAAMRLGIVRHLVALIEVAMDTERVVLGCKGIQAICSSPPEYKQAARKMCVPPWVHQPAQSALGDAGVLALLSGMFRQRNPHICAVSAATMFSLCSKCPTNKAELKKLGLINQCINTLHDLVQLEEQGKATEETLYDLLDVLNLLRVILSDPASALNAIQDGVLNDLLPFLEMENDSVRAHVLRILTVCCLSDTGKKEIISIAADHIFSCARVSDTQNSEEWSVSGAAIAALRMLCTHEETKDILWAKGAGNVLIETVETARRTYSNSSKAITLPADVKQLIINSISALACLYRISATEQRDPLMKLSFMDVLAQLHRMAEAKDVNMKRRLNEAAQAMFATDIPV